MTKTLSFQFPRSPFLPGRRFLQILGAVNPRTFRGELKNVGLIKLTATPMKALFFLPKPRYLLSLASLFHTFPNPNPNFQRPPSHKLDNRPPPYRHWDLPIPTPRQTLNPNPNPDPNFSQADFSSICALLADPALSSGASLEDALSRTGIKPCSGLLQAIFGHFDSSPKPLFTLFCWAVKQPGFESSETLFNFMVDVLAKSRAFDSAWLLLLDHAEAGEQPHLVSSNTFSILIRRYARAGNA